MIRSMLSKLSKAIQRLISRCEELAFRLGTCGPLLKFKMNRQTVARTLLGTGWFLMGLQAIQEWAIAASTACSTTQLYSCSSGCSTILQNFVFCCATLLNASGSPIACCQFTCEQDACFPPLSSSSSVANCSGTIYIQSLLGVYSLLQCSSGGCSVGSGGSGSTSMYPARYLILPRA